MSATLSDAAVEWLTDGEHGLSSRYMFEALLLGRHGRVQRPLDIDDFRRCELLRRSVPEVADRLSLMADESGEWAVIVEHWDEIAALAEEDVPGIFDEWRSGRAEKAWARWLELGL